MPASFQHLHPAYYGQQFIQRVRLWIFDGYHWMVFFSFSTANPFQLRSLQSLAKRSSGMCCYLDNIQRSVQSVLLTTEQVQFTSSNLTIQQLPYFDDKGNFTKSLELDFFTSSGSTIALPIMDTFSPLMQQIFSTFTELSGFVEYMAVVFWQLDWKGAGIDACSYHCPMYFDRSTQSTVLGGSKAKLAQLLKFRVLMQQTPNDKIRPARSNPVLFMT